MNILGPSKTTPAAAAVWAVGRGATNTFVALADLYWRFAPERGVRPEVAYAQAAKETGFGGFGGVITAQWRNPCGLKTADGGDNGDADAHQKFPTWEVGVIAHLDHLALYAGAIGYPKVYGVPPLVTATPDPRHFASLWGKAPSVEQLSGNWAGDGYGESLRDSYVKALLSFEAPPDPVVDPAATLTDLSRVYDTLTASMDVLADDKASAAEVEEIKLALGRLEVKVKNAAGALS